jgi:hypothetical protein
VQVLVLMNLNNNLPLGSPGQGLLNFACSAKTSAGSTYLLHGISELERHPTEPNTCLVKTVGYDDGLVDQKLELCNAAGELRDPDASAEGHATLHGMVRGVEVRMVGGRSRCAVDLSPGLSPDHYDAYEITVRDRAVQRSMPYRQLLIEYEALLELVRLAEIKRDDLKASNQRRKDQLKELTATVEKTRAEITAKKAGFGRLEDEYKKEQAAADMEADKLARLQADRDKNLALIKNANEMAEEIMRQVKNVKSAPAVQPVARPAASAAPAAPAPASGSSAKDYRFMLETMTRGNHVVDVSAKSMRAGQPVHIWTRHNDTNQIWKWRDDSIVNERSGMCLDVSGARTNNGAHIIQHHCHGRDNQKWKVDGSKLRPFHAPDKCLDVVGKTKNGAKLVMHSCHGGNNQNFREIRI